jgi:hypothetical protein
VKILNEKDYQLLSSTRRVFRDGMLVKLQSDLSEKSSSYHKLWIFAILVAICAIQPISGDDYTKFWNNKRY